MPIITICRKLGVHGIEIADMIAKEMHYDLLDKETIAKMLKEYGFSDGAEIDSITSEKKPSFLSSFFTDRERSIDYTKKLLYDFAQKGNVIIIGMGSQSVFNNFPNTLHLNITAPEQIRIERLKKKISYDELQAAQIIRDSDNARAGFYKFFFNIDWNDFDLYDIVINMRNFSFQKTVEIIKKAVEDIQEKAEEKEMSQRLRDLIIMQDVKIITLHEKKISLSNFNVEVNDGVVTLYGGGLKKTEKTSYEETIAQITGVKEVVTRITGEI